VLVIVISKEENGAERLILSLLDYYVACSMESGIF
jgi:hypothetical protein